VLRGDPTCFLFRDERHPTVRIEACETKRRYVKSSISPGRLPLPEVDDLVDAMDLWADQGYSRIELGLPESESSPRALLAGFLGVEASLERRFDDGRR
jgi:hypothetical protein